VFEGQFGAWRVEKEDEDEVFAYRLGLNVCAASFGLLIPASLLAPASLPGRDAVLNAAYTVGSLGFGTSLYFIHIYITPAKRFLQGLFLAGALGSLFVLSRDGFGSVPGYVVEHPGSVWFVGPLFASITGVGFKEGVCYQKREAFALAALTPLLLLTHLTRAFGENSPAVEAGLCSIWSATFLSFALSKWSQPVHEDIGDKSVFTFMKLPEKEQQRILKSRNEL